MITCELCNKKAEEGYLVIDKKLDSPYFICRNCGRPFFNPIGNYFAKLKGLTKKNKSV